MKLVELAYFTENVQPMVDFYQKLLGAEPVAKSEDMAIFMSGETKILIHYQSPASPIYLRRGTALNCQAIQESRRVRRSGRGCNL